MMAVANSLSVGVIGAGPGGLALGIFLRKAGFRDFTIFDREDGVGGTWRINTYRDWPVTSSHTCTPTHST